VHSSGPVAAIDCGTNSTRLLVADADGRSLVRLMRITRLGEGVDARRMLSDAAIDRCTAVLEEYREVMEQLGVVRSRLVATSAVRDASNGSRFLRAAATASGVEPELLSGTEEGVLSMAGALGDLGDLGDLGSTDDLESGGRPILVLDIGGGSTELVVGTGPEDPLLTAVSLQVGCVRVSERFLPTDPPTRSELSGARTMISDMLERVIEEKPHVSKAGILVGLAGSVSTLSSLELRLETYDADRLHHSVLTIEQVGRWLRALSTESRRARLARPGMISGREDVIVGGALILSVVMERLGFDRCLVSETDILDGMVAELLALPNGGTASRVTGRPGDAG
jgi:exopolyphosphatase / guanosine-5'-triphosphate,3'-diphosphate pyrophosphatase